MRLQTKKIIAKEFLILIIVLSLGLVGFLFTYLHNSFKKNQVADLNKTVIEKTKLVDSLSQPYKTKSEKQNWFFNQFSQEFDAVKNDPEYYTKEKVWNRLANLAMKNSIKYKWEKVWDKELIDYNKKIGFSTPDSFKKFIELNRLSEFETNNYNESLKRNKEIDSLKLLKGKIETKVLSFNQQIKFGLKSAIISAVVLFVLRYLFYAIRWSVKTLNQKSG